MKASDYIVSFLKSRGIDVVFGYIGGMVTHLVDSISSAEGLRFVQTYHEQSAAFAAEGYASESGKIGVAVSTSGPGATNMLTGVADAWFDSVPVLYITGQVNSYEYKYDKPVRQQGFQETDIVSIASPITKYAALVDDASRLRYELEKACYTAMEGRKGPVLLDICMDVQRTEIDPEALESFVPPVQKKNSTYDIAQIAQLLGNASRPMLLVGAGAKDSGSLVAKFLEMSGFPAVHSLLGKGVVDGAYRYNMGMLGSYGNRCANMAMKDVDVLLVLGARLDTRQTGARIDAFIEHGTIIQVDIDQAELEGNRLQRRMKVCDSVGNFLEKLLSYGLSFRDLAGWQDELLALKQEYSQDREIERFVSNKAPYKLMSAINRYAAENDVFVADIGHNQMFAAQMLDVSQGRRFVTGGGLAPMGYSLPVAVGTAFASPSKRVISISGDGGFHMALQSLMLISQYDLPVIPIVLNNRSLGMITQFQHLYFNDRMPATTEPGGYRTPDFSAIARAYSLEYFCLTEDDLENSILLDEVFSRRNCIVEFVTDSLTTVSPKLEYNKPVYKPSPDID